MTPAEAIQAGVVAPPVEPEEVDEEKEATDVDEGSEESLHRKLTRLWDDRPGFIGRLTTVNHKTIATRFFITAFVFFLLAGLESALMRIQLARPENAFIGPDLYNQLFSTHGTTMLFLFAVPMTEAMGLYFVPLMVGTRNVAFPRLNALGYYTYLIGGVLLYVGLFTNTGPDSGWFSYVPLSGPEYSPGKRTDVWAQMITFTEVAGIIGAIEIVTTAFKQRAPGMSLNRVPLFVWAMVVQAFMILFALPMVASASFMLAFDRLVSTHFFNQAEGGDPLLWQHLFWFFGHPEVYIIFIPALGAVASIVATFCRRPNFGYTAAVLSLVSMGFLSFGLWVHHMFATPIPQMGQSFFTAASAMITIPTGILIFCTIATMAAGRPRFATPMLFVLGFVAIFTIGGLTGVMLASVPLDLQLTDTYFVPGHIHYVLIGGMFFPLIGAAHYWFPKVTGRMMSERMGKWEFALLFVGTNLTFFPFFLMALNGMPRRIYTYLAETGWAPLNQLSTAGAAVFAAGVLLFIVNVVASLRRGAPAGANPWGGETLEWATASPPPNYNFAHIPIVRGRSALWDPGAELPVATGLSEERREVLLTTVLDAEPDVRHEVPGPSIGPLLTALAVGVTFIAGIFTPWGFVYGPALVFLGLLVWFWPRPKPADALLETVEVPR